jgi:hypothetical protein
MLEFVDFSLTPEFTPMAAARVVLKFFCLLACLSAASAQTKYALLIGIDTYQPPNTTVKHPAGANTGRFAPGAPLFYNLTGPTNDVASMRSVLTSTKFGFPDDEQHIHVLDNEAATRQGILAAMNQYLVEQPSKGDIAVLYIAAHGSLRVNSKSNKQVFDLAGKPTPLDNTIVPADAYLGVEDVRDREIARILNKALDKGVRVTAIFDTCHSGGTARGADAGPRTIGRSLPYDPRDIAEAPDTNPDGTPVIAPEDRKDNSALVLDATQVDQEAKELPDASPPHGVFTMALIDALEVLPAGIPATDLWKRIQVDLEVQGRTGQQPQLDGTRERKRQPLFGGEAETGTVRAAALGQNDDGTVVLDVGPVADVGTGSEFVSLSQDKKVVLRITGPVGINRSRAEVVSPAGATVAAKDVFELSKWVPAEKKGVYFWVPASSLTEVQIESAIEAVRSAGVTLVRDPSLQAWSHLIRWDGSQWVVGTAGKPGAEPLGSTLTAAVLKDKLPRQSVLWLDLPPSAELSTRLQRNNPQSTTDAEKALYLLAGLPTDNGPVYFWYNRGEYIAGRQTPRGYSDGCSPDTPYPIRTTWFSGADAAESLKQSADELAKLNHWLTLQSAENSSSGYPYHLALQRVGDGAFVEDKDASHEGEDYLFVLQAKGDTRTESRFVYVLSIDCQGNGVLMFPEHGASNRFPQEGGRMEQIPLPRSRFHIIPPFGTDTYILLTTSTELADPEALNFSGVVRGGETPPASPVESMIRSSDSHFSPAAMPTDWGVETFELHSHPK